MIVVGVTNSTQVLKPNPNSRLLSLSNCAEPFRKTNTKNQQFDISSKLKLKYEVNLRFETHINFWVQTRKIF